jgi:hypothetical protein
MDTRALPGIDDHAIDLYFALEAFVDTPHG